MIAFACPSCGKKLSVRDENAGKRGNCPHCKKTVLVPAVARSPSLEVTAAQPDDTPSSSDGDSPKLDFLAKPQANDELGRLGQYRV